MDLSRFGLSTFLCPGMNLWKWLDLAWELGLGGVELRADPWAAHPAELSSLERAQLREKAQQMGLWLTVHAPIYDVNPASPNLALAQAALAELAAAVDLAGDMGADLLVVHPGHVHEDYVQMEGAYTKAWQQMTFVLKVLVEKARPRGVRIAVENKQKSRVRDLVLTWEEHVRALEEVPGLTACLDLGHLFTTAADFRPYVAALGSRLVHVHLHDNHGQRDEHLGLGQGEVPWLAFLALLEEVGYTGRVVLELPRPEDVRAAVEALRGGR